MQSLKKHPSAFCVMPGKTLGCTELKGCFATPTCCWGRQPQVSRANISKEYWKAFNNCPSTNCCFFVNLISAALAPECAEQQFPSFDWGLTWNSVLEQNEAREEVPDLCRTGCNKLSSISCPKIHKAHVKYTNKTQWEG